VDEDVYERVSGAERLLFGAVLCGWVDGARELIPSIYGRVTLDGFIVSSYGSRVWVPSGALRELPAADSLAHRLLSIDSTTFPELRPEEIRFAHRVSSIEASSPSKLLIKGRSCDPLTAFSADPGALTGRAMAELRDDGATFSSPVRIRAREQLLEWEFVLSVPPMQPFMRPMKYDVRIEIEGSDGVNASPVFLDDKAPVVLASRPWTIRGLLRQTFSLYPTPSGRLALRLRQTPGRRGRIEEWLLGMTGGDHRMTGR
jgi:hypothetical protein